MSEHAPEAPTGVVDRLNALAPTLSGAAAHVAQVLRADPLAASRFTAAELAVRAGASAPTVVRLARALGFTGWTDLRLALASAPALDPAAAVTAAGLDVDLDDAADAVIGKLLQFEVDQLRGTAELLDRPALERVVAACTGARKVSVYGVGASGLVAADLARKLNRVGLLSQECPELDRALPDAALLGPRDVAIAFSHSGSSPGAVLPLRVAAGRGATTAAVTGRASSPLTAHADVVLLTAGREFGFRPAAMASRTGQLFTVDVLFTGVVTTLPGALEALQRTHDSLHEEWTEERRR